MMRATRCSPGQLRDLLTTEIQRSRSTVFIRALEQLRRFNRDDSTTLLLEGESGTGKTTLAETLHLASARADKPFVAGSLASMDDTLASTDLFGHVVGAYTDAKRARPGLFNSAHGGTLFLDEIGKASLDVQRKLLGVLESGQFTQVGGDRPMRVDVRLIFASNIPVAELVEAGSFLPDLYARFATFRTTLPPLRDRGADIEVLVARALARHASSAGYESVPAVDAELMSALKLAPWQYNLRELDQVMHRLLLEAEGAPEILLDHCRSELRHLRELAADDIPLSRDRIEQALEEAGGNVSAAARRLKVHRTTLYRRVAGATR